MQFAIPADTPVIFPPKGEADRLCAIPVPAMACESTEENPLIGKPQQIHP